MDPQDSGRDETPEERLDRKWNDLLQELRVMQTGVQLTAGFLLTLPFQERFWELDRVQHASYLVLVVLAAVTTGLVLAPVAVHRRLTGQDVKERVVRAAHVTSTAALTCVALLVVGIITFTFDVVVDRTWALVAGAGMALVLLGLMVVLPRSVALPTSAAHGSEKDSSEERRAP